MSRLVYILLLIVVLFGGCSENNTVTPHGTNEIHGNGNVISRTIELLDFNSISNMVLNKVHFKRGDRFSLVLKGEQNILDAIKTEVKDGLLEFALEEGKSISTNFPVEAEIIMPEIFSILEVGACSYTLEGEIQNQLGIDIIGAGTVDATRMEVNKCFIKITGTGSCFVKVVDLLDVIITGAGIVYYWGSPQLNTVIIGVGNVVKK